MHTRLTHAATACDVNASRFPLRAISTTRLLASPSSITHHNPAVGGTNDETQ